MPIPQAIVWLDEQDAVLCFLHGDDEPFTHRHVAAHPSHGHPLREPFFQDIAQALADVDEVLVVGPAAVMRAFQAFAAACQPGLGERIRGVESADPPSAARQVASARAFFTRVDAMDGRFPIDLR